MLKVIDLVKDRCNLLSDFVTQATYFFVAPAEYDLAAVKPKWTAEKAAFFDAYTLLVTDNATALELEEKFKELAGTHQFKPGELMLPLRIMLVGGKFGPGVFDIALVLGAAETVQRIKNALTAFN